MNEIKICTKLQAIGHCYDNSFGKVAKAYTPFVCDNTR